VFQYTPQHLPVLAAPNQPELIWVADYIPRLEIICPSPNQVLTRLRVQQRHLIVSWCCFSAKARRQVKAVKPKKMIRVEGKMIVSSACNCGTSALVSRDGEVFVFGKDAFHCDNTTGMSLYQCL